jgi:predicted ATPase
VVTELHIENLRGIAEAHLTDLTGLVVITGPNNSGKSTILDALYITCTREQGDALLHRLAQRRQGLPADSATSWLLRRGPRDALLHPVLRVATDANGRQLREFGFYLQGERVQYRTPLEELGLVTECRLVDATMASQADSLVRLYSKAKARHVLEFAEAPLRELIPGFRRLDLLVDHVGQRDTPLLYMDLEHVVHPVALAGDGIQALVRQALELGAPPGSLVLMEEPEAHLHPGAMQQTARLILAAVRRDVQVILTTHSMEFLDLMLSEMTDEDEAKLTAFGVRLEEGILLVDRKTGSDVQFARAQIGEDLR